MKVCKLLPFACLFFTCAAMAQDSQANVPDPNPAPLSAEMKAWIEHLSSANDGPVSTRQKAGASSTWSYPSSTPSTPYGGGSGTSSSPYLISTTQHLANFAYMVNNGTNYSGKYFKMTADLVLNSNVLNADGSLRSGSHQAWTPIGTSSNSFMGNFDGNGHYVSGIYINNSSMNYQGLFGRAADGTISNLGVEDSYIYGYNYVAGILGHSDHTSLSRCYSAATVIASNYDAGGIVGDDYGGGGSSGSVSSSSITACANYGLITATSSCAGGIIGYGSCAVTVSYCINYGKITGTGNCTGGIVGENGCAITNCANTGTINITGTETTYGAICYASSATNCYYLAGCCDKAGGGTSKTASQFADGTVLNLLDPSHTYFVQGTDGYPVLIGINKRTASYGYGNAPSDIAVIDLGLPSGTLWANMNVGATSVTGKGCYYGWGGLTNNSTNYSSATSYSSDIDAATVKWGNNWQMPSEAQFQELINKCTWTYVTSYQGVSITGMLLTGPNGNKLFLPTTGLVGSDNGWGNYWSSTVVSSSQAKSLAFENTTSSITIYQNREKSNGQFIRPIYTGGYSGVSATNVSSMSYAVYAQPSIARKGSQTTLTVCMKNTQPITLWQADLTLPAGFTLATDAYGDPKVNISGSRTSTSRHSIATSTLSDGSIRILCSSSSNKTFTGTDGEVATITLNVASSVNNGDYAVKFNNIMLVEANETKHEVDEVVSVITVKNYTLGDVNNDGSIDGVDLVGIVNCILDRPTAGNIFEAADVNQDGVIDGSDYVREVNAILGKVVLSARRNAQRAESPEAAYAIYANDFKGVSGKQTTLCLNMKNDQPVTLWQADLVLPEGVSIAKDDFDDPMVYITGGRTTDARHAIATNTLPDGSIRILCSSSSNKTFTGNDGEVVTITLNIDNDMESGEYPVALKNILIVEADETKHNCDQTECTLSVTRSTGIKDINNGHSAMNNNVFNLAGQQLNKPQRGINIIRRSDGTTVKVKN